MKKEVFNKTLKFFLPILGCLHFLFACKKEYDPHLPDFYLTADQKKLIPYKSTDSLLFINESGDTIIYIPWEYKTEMVKETYYADNTESYRYIEKTSCIFKEKDSSYCLKLGLWAGSTSTLGGAYFDKFPNEDSRKSDYFDISDNLNKNIIDLSADSLFFDSLKINNKYYKYVYKILSRKKDILFHPLNKMSAIFYTKTNGIIQTEFIDSSYWKIVNH